MSGTRQAATEALDRATSVGHGAMEDAAVYAGEWIRKYPLHALAVGFIKGVLLGLYLRK